MNIDCKNPLLSFDDVLLEPLFSGIRSRQDVDTSSDFLGLKLSLPITNSNMDTIASPELSKVLADYGTVGSLHRFCSIEENVRFLKTSIHNGIVPIVSVGVGSLEISRALVLYEAGARIFLLDVAHAASINVVEMYRTLLKGFSGAKFIVGNFGTHQEVAEFLNNVDRKPDAICVGIGGGSLCTTRVVTGVGIPTLASILDCREICDKYEMKMMVNGGFRNSGDIVKGLAAGADLIMLGSMFAGADESGGKYCIDCPTKFDSEKAETVYGCGSVGWCSSGHKEYRGSASSESYKVQGKEAAWRAPEGESTWIPLKGPAVGVLNTISGGIRSACSYLDASNLDELREHARFQFVTSNTVVENQAHGKIRS